MSEQESVERRVARDSQDEIDSAPDGAIAERRAAMDSDVDAILDEIDGVLEENAEEFVKSFVQKGGQ
jgi:ubiquitin-like protein Pup